MAKFSLEIDCDNDAFAEHGIVPELRRLLKVARWTIGQVHHDGGLMFCTQKLFDKNGNAVGVWRYQPVAGIEAVVIPAALFLGDPPRGEPEVTSETPPEMVPGSPGYLRQALDRAKGNQPDTAPGTSFLGDPPRPKGEPSFMAEFQARSRVRRRNPGEPLCTPPDTPSLDTSFHDHEMDVNDDRYPARRAKRVKKPGTPQLRAPVRIIPPSAFEITEADEVAANMSLETITTWDDAKAYARGQMPGESEQILDNVADALMTRRDQEVAKTAPEPFLSEEMRQRAQIIADTAGETRWVVHTVTGWRIKAEPAAKPGYLCIRIDPVKGET